VGKVQIVEGERNDMQTSDGGIKESQCFHCGESFSDSGIILDQKQFCCAGCKTVYQILSKHNLCEYYNHSEKPGINQRVTVRKGKFAFLDDDAIANKLIQFEQKDAAQVCFYLPQIHCNSCLWLLENLHQLNKGIIASRVDFEKKEITVSFSKQQTSLRKVAETLASVGYEPHTSLNDLGDKNKLKRGDKSSIYRLGVAGFCFSNIMMLSFPEYFGLTGLQEDKVIATAFKAIILLLSLPVFFYSAREFFISGWQGIKHRFLNIDAPIALAILITFTRSIYEIVSGTGAGYLDSMSGIVFFMLAGRLLQDRTRQSLSFDRDYTSYFPVAVTKLVAGIETAVALPLLRTGDTVIIHSNEIIPADGILVRGNASIDYSFVTGESSPVQAKVSEICYAGGRQLGGNIELLLVKDVSQSYLTSLWNRESMKKEDNSNDSFVHKISQYFTIVLFSIATFAGIWWAFHDATKVWPAVTSVLIVACPCALLLSNSFTNSHIIRLFDRAGLYVRNAAVVERMCRINRIVFDKTGTLTNTSDYWCERQGDSLSMEQMRIIGSLAAQSNHPLSRAVVNFFKVKPIQLEAVKETVGKGMEAWHNDKHIVLGNPEFVWGNASAFSGKTIVGYRVDDTVNGWFEVTQQYRKGLYAMFLSLRKKYSLSVISGDNNGARQSLEALVGNDTEVLFNQHPTDKLNYTEKLGQQGENVLMVGDGLNDAGALKQSLVGIAVAEDINNFSPACDAVMQADKLTSLHHFLALALVGKRIVYWSFIISICYNVVGLSYAVQAKLSPMVAAILMPASSISIIIFTWLSVEIAAQKLREKVS
jgi:Cu+-exporting ATPase